MLAVSRFLPLQVTDWSRVRPSLSGRLGSDCLSADCSPLVEIPGNPADDGDLQGLSLSLENGTFPVTGGSALSVLPLEKLLDVGSSN